MPMPSRTLRYSGSERPACRMNHTGVCGTGSPRAAFTKADSCRTAGVEAAGIAPIVPGQAACSHIGTGRDLTCGEHGGRQETHPGTGADSSPPEFRAAVTTMRAARLRPRCSARRCPRPQRIAPFAAALTADVTVDGNDLGTRADRPAARPRGQRRLGRHLPLRRLRTRRDRARAGHRPDAGRGRLVVADRGPRRARRGVRRRRRAPSRASATESFGGMADEEARPRAAPRTIRCLGPPDRADVTAHVEAWGELLCTAVGLEPVPEGVTTDPEPAGQRGPGRWTSPERRRPPRPRPRTLLTRRGSLPLRPLLRLRDGLGKIVETEAGLAEVCAAWRAGTGPVAIDAERASGYRYSARAYLIQLRREGSGTFLVDPIAFDSMALAAGGPRGHRVDPARRDPGPALPQRGRPVPHELFDTELAGRLLGYPRVGLATLVETCSATGWPRSTRRSTGRPGPCRSRGWSTPPSTSRSSSSCARCSAPSWSRPARTAGPARSSSG